MKALLVGLLFCAISMCSAGEYRLNLIGTLTKQNKHIYEYQYKNWYTILLTWKEAENACKSQRYKYLKTFLSIMLQKQFQIKLVPLYGLPQRKMSLLM